MAMAKSFARAERSSRLLDKGLREHIPSRIRKYREKVTIYDPLYSTVCQWQNFGPLAQVIAKSGLLDVVKLLLLRGADVDLRLHKQSKAKKKSQPNWHAFESELENDWSLE